MRTDDELWDYYREWELNLSAIEPEDEQVADLLEALTEEKTDRLKTLMLEERDRLKTLMLRKMSQLDQAEARLKK